MDDNLPQILTIEETSIYLRIPLSSLYKLAQEGRVPCQKVGRHWRFYRPTLIEWVSSKGAIYGSKNKDEESYIF